MDNGGKAGKDGKKAKAPRKRVSSAIKRQPRVSRPRVLPAVPRTKSITVKDELDIIRQIQAVTNQNTTITITPLGPNSSSSSSNGFNAGPAAEPEITISTLIQNVSHVSPSPNVVPASRNGAQRKNSVDFHFANNPRGITYGSLVPPPAHSTPFRYGLDWNMWESIGKQPEPAHKFWKEVYTHDILPMPPVGLPSRGSIERQHNLAWYNAYRWWCEYYQAMAACIFNQQTIVPQQEYNLNGHSTSHCFYYNDVNPHPNVCAPPTLNSILRSSMYQEAATNIFQWGQPQQN